MSKFVIRTDEARMLAKAHLEECRHCIAKAKEWTAHTDWKNHLEGRRDYLIWAKNAAQKAKYWYKKLGLTFGTPALRTDEPPRDGRYIRVIGRIISQQDACTCVDPFCSEVRWTELPGQSKGWHFSNGLAVASTLEDEIKIDAWRELPVTL